MSLTPTQRKRARYLIRRYCERAEASEDDIHYSQARPMTHLGEAPEGGFTADCSGFVTGAYYWASIYMHHKVADPNGLAYSGYGFTGTLLAHNLKRRVPASHRYFIGDMALYGTSFSNTHHVTICRKGGKGDAAVWTSHGNETGPYSVRLHYRPDLLCVVRHEGLA